MDNYEEMAKAFEVEELEERLEFRKWKTTGKAEIKCDTDGNCEGSVGVEIAF